MANDLSLPVTVVDQFTPTFAKLRNEIAAINKVPGLQNMRKEWDSIRERIGGVTREVSGGLVPAFGGLNAASLGVAAAVSAATVGFKNFVNTGVGLRTLSQETGVAVAQIKALETLGGRLNIDPSSMNGAVKTFAQNMYELKHRYGEMFQGLFPREGGRELIEKLFNAKDVNQAFEIAMAQLGSMQNPQNRQNVARLLFGTDDMSILAGRYGKEFVNEFRKVIASQPPVDTQAALQAKDQLRTLSENLKNFSDELYSKALPGVNELMTSLGRPVGSGLGEVISGMARDLKALGDVGLKIEQGEYGSALKALLGRTLGSTEGKAGINAGMAIRNALGMSFATGPIVNQIEQAKRQKAQLEEVLSGKEARGDEVGAGDTRRRLDRLNDELRKLTEQLTKVQQQGAQIQQQSFSGGGGLGSLIQTAAFGGFGGGSGDDNADRRGMGTPMDKIRDALKLRRSYPGGSPGGGRSHTSTASPGGTSVPDSVPMTDAERNMLGLILKHESGGRNVMNYKGVGLGLHPETKFGYTAQGYFQILNSNWRRLAPKLGITTPNAMASDLEDQTKVALALLRESGPGNWKPLVRALARGEKAGPWGRQVPIAGGSSQRGDQDVGFSRDDASWGGSAARRSDRNDFRPAYDRSLTAGDDMMRRAMGPSNTQKVEGSASIDLTINGLPTPKYRARTSMDGMFKDVKVSPGKSQVSSTSDDGVDI